MGEQRVFVDYNFLRDSKLDSDIQCKTCDKGTLHLQVKYRMGGIVATIGYILLIPSVLGTIVSIIVAFISGTAIRGYASGIGAIFGLLSAILFFVSGLLGWLLILKKRVLQCGNCGATTAAS